MSARTNSFLGKYFSKFIQPAILLLLLLIVWQTFSSNRSEEILKEQLDKTETNLAAAIFSLEKAKSNIDSLKTKLLYFDEKSKFLTLERDSLLLKFKRENAANWKALQNIVKRQKEVNAELTYLRNKNKDFE